jgi:hypothetical protein
MGMLALKMNSSFIQLNNNYTRARSLYKKETNVSLDNKIFIYTKGMNEFSFIWYRVFALNSTK